MPLPVDTLTLGWNDGHCGLYPRSHPNPSPVCAWACVLGLVQARLDTYPQLSACTSTEGRDMLNITYLRPTPWLPDGGALFPLNGP